MSPGLRRYIIVRALLTIPMVLILVTFVFFVLRVIPGDPALAIMREGASDEQLCIVRVPGAFEIPVACRQLAQSRKVDAVIALGCVIRGATAHFEYVSSAATSGCAQVATSTGVPVIFGVLTTVTIDQAIERAGTKAGNKGAESAVAALEMASLFRILADKGYQTPES